MQAGGALVALRGSPQPSLEVKMPAGMNNPKRTFVKTIREVGKMLRRSRLIIIS